MVLSEIGKKARLLLMGRRSAYVAVFNPDNVYPDDVLKDLAKFCRAHESTFHGDPRVHAVMEGRREVWLRIANHLNLDPDKLWALYGEGKKG